MTSKLTLLNDRALGEGAETPVDGLGFSVYAEVLAEAARNTPGPFTIGVFGEWGTGKTSLMRMTKAQLANNKEILSVWFNAWQYEREEHPIIPLIASIIQSLKQNQGLLATLGDKGTSLINSLRAVAYSFAINVNAGVVQGSWDAQKAIDREAELNADRLMERSLHLEAFERLAQVQLPGRTKVVVFIDDLDRCMPDHAIALLESIKLVLAQDRFVFVLGVAPRVSEDFLSHRFEKDYGIQGFRSHTYLDKLIQLPFVLPPHAPRISTLYAQLVNRIDHSLKAQFTELFPIFESVAAGNPRALIRLLNNVILDVEIYGRLYSSAAPSRIPLAIFAVTRSLQQRWPVAFRAISDDESVCNVLGDWSEETISRLAADKAEPYNIVACELAADKVLRSLLQGPAGKRWLSQTEARREAIHFLRSERPTEQPQREKTRPWVYALFDSRVGPFVHRLTSEAPDIPWGFFSMKDGDISASRAAQLIESDAPFVVFMGAEDLKKTTADFIASRPNGSVFRTRPDTSGSVSARLPSSLVFDQQTKNEFFDRVRECVSKWAFANGILWPRSD